MARSGNTDLVFNERFFETILREPKVEAAVDAAAARALAAAKASAPVDSGDYRNGLHLEHHDSRYRRATRVVGSDSKTMLVESRTGNLARSIKAAKS